ncbi:MAG: SpoIIIAH-like family protein [Alicyclobacillus sp.]|nr:SpoIIIAH-like family protein [Alicyclobacillus sp.]
MVKRQTVWLSTMMVLSLMLIGYYTMNGDTSWTGSKSGSGTSVATSVGVPGSDQSGGATGSSAASTGSASASTQAATGSAPASAQAANGSKTGSNASSSSTTSKPATSTTSSNPASGSDWYVTMQTQLQQQFSQQMDTYMQVISNNNATADQIGQARQKLDQLQTVKGELDNARDIIIGKGFQDCVIIPDANYQKAVVYVKADKLSQDQAVQIMNVVSTQLNIPMVNVEVHAKA